MAISNFRAGLRAQQPAEPSPFFSVQEAARMLGCSEMTLYRAIRENEFPGVHIRGRIIVPRVAIERVIEGALEANGLVDAADYVAKKP